VNQGADPFVGKVIDGRYEIQARIGEGGMGVVYRCKQISIDRTIAIKMLNAQMAADPQWVQRFYNEAKACSRLQHPNTIRMFDFGQSSEGRLFMTMEFLDGISLRDALAPGPLAPQRVVKILIQCCASLAEAHSIGIIHRDIKPDNVFLLNMAGSPDFVKLLDFSVAKLLEGDRMKTQAGVVFGTPQYMSPEQGRGLPLDARSDLYALGILAHEMLSGTVPYNDENPMTVIQMHLHQPVPPMPAGVPYSVQQIVRRAMEKDAARRYQSAGEMMQHCQQVFAELNAGAGGGVAIGPGGMPRTVLAPGGVPAGIAPPLQQPQQQMQQMQQQQMTASPVQKTMIVQAGGAPMQQMQQQSGLAPQQGGNPNAFLPASPMQKTIVAGMMPPVIPPQAQPPQGGMGQAYNPNAMQPVAQTPNGGYGPPNQPGGANKTVMLQPSDGIVSVADRGGVVPTVESGASIGGASTAFWIVSMLVGIMLGVIGYVIVLQTQ
jgi:serine/threonine-protein kinase